MPPKHAIGLLRQDAILSVGSNFHHPSFGQGGCSHASGCMNALLLIWVASVTLLLKSKSRVSNVQIQPKFDAHNTVSFPVPALHDPPYGLSTPVKQEISQILMKCQVSALFKVDCPKGWSANAVLPL